jgi:hypothetical protein
LAYPAALQRLALRQSRRPRPNRSGLSRCLCSTRPAPCALVPVHVAHRVPHSRSIDASTRLRQPEQAAASDAPSQPEVTRRSMPACPRQRQRTSLEPEPARSLPFFAWRLHRNEGCCVAEPMNPGCALQPAAAQQPCSSRGASCTNCRPGAVCASVAYLGGPLSQRRVRLPHFDRVQPRNGHGRPQAPWAAWRALRAYSTHRAQLHAEAVLGCTVVVRMIASSPKQASKGFPVLRVTCEHLKACFTIRICRMWRDLSAQTADPYQCSTNGSLRLDGRDLLAP